MVAAPVIRDCFTALDVALLQIPFLVQGLQTNPRQVKLVLIVWIIVVFVCLPVAALVNTRAGVIATAGVFFVGYVAQAGVTLASAKPGAPSLATWIVTTFSAVHYVTQVNLYHPVLKYDHLIQGGRAVVYVCHVLTLAILVFIFTVMEPLYIAWGCYGNAPLKDLDLGPCGEDTTLGWPTPQMICRKFAFDLDTGGGVCAGKSSPLQYFDRHASAAVHVQTFAFAVYCVCSWHAYASYWLHAVRKDTTMYNTNLL